MTSPQEHPTVFGTIRSMTVPVQVLMWGTFISNLAAFLNAFLVLFLTQAKGMPSYYAGIALGVMLAGRIAGTALGGAMADRIGYRWTIVISMLGNAIGVAAMVQVTQPWQAIALAALIGTIAQAYRPASQAWIMELTPIERHVMIFSIYRLAYNVGTTVGPLVAALIIQYSYALLFYADAAAALIFGLVALLTLNNDRPPRKEAGAAATGTPVGYGAVLRDGRFMLVVFGLFLTAVVYIQGSAALPVFITGTGHPAQLYALLLSLHGLMVISLEIFLTKYSQRLPIRIPIIAGMLLLGFGHLLYLAPSVAVLFIATFVWTLGEIVAAPSMLAYPGRVAPVALRARYVAAATIPQQAGYALGPLIGLAAWYAWGSGIWLLTGGLGLVAAVVTVLGARKVPDAADAAPAPEPPGDAEPPSVEPEAVPVAALPDTPEASQPANK